MKDRERENRSGGTEGDGERENPKQALHCLHGAWCEAQTWELWDHDLSQNQELDAQPAEPPGTPQLTHLTCTVQWVLGYPEMCTPSAQSILEYFHHFKKRSHSLRVVLCCHPTPKQPLVHLKKCLFIYLFWEREGAERERERERKRGRENPKQALYWQCRAQLGAQSHGHEIMTLVEIRSWTLNPLSHPGAPLIDFLSV